MILSWIVWDPPREIFIIPILNWPIVWYGAFFALGFGLGYYIFIYLLRRFFYFFPLLVKKDVLNWGRLAKEVEEAKLSIKIQKKNEEESLKALNQYLLDSEPNAELEPPSKLRRLFAKFPRPDVLLKRFFLETKLSKSLLSIPHKAYLVTDRFTIFMILATVLGARFGHFIFYERPSDYIHRPLELLKIWEGGLASHGAAIAIIVMILCFGQWAKKFCKSLNWVTLLDLVCIPTALAGTFIRIGNFFNQEILGKASNLPWAIIFPHPMDSSLSIVPRHPVQLYEAIFYLATFFFLLFLSHKPKVFLNKGKLIGTFLVLVFVFRFFVEFLKEEQSEILSSVSQLNMGQYLSIPLVMIGVFFLFYSRIFRCVEAPLKS